MLALAEQEALSCHGCGGWLPETTLLENDGRYKADFVRCHSCTAQGIANEQHTGGKDGAKQPQALRWSVPKLKPRG